MGLKERVEKLEKTSEESKPTWRSVCFEWLRVLLVPIALMAIKEYCIDRPQREVRLQYEIERSDDEVDSNNVFTFRITNVGNRALEEDQAYAMLRFQGRIIELRGRDNFPLGTQIVGGTCDGKNSCRVNLGYLAAGGEFGMVLVANSNLATVPNVNYGGRSVAGTCSGLRPDMQSACSGS